MTTATNTFDAMLADLNARVTADITEESLGGWRPVAVHTTEMADGSRRWCSIISYQLGDAEKYVRVATPAPAGAPLWAAALYTTHSVVEVEA